MENQVKCPKCEGDMAKGFVLDYAQSAVVVPTWHEGSPKKSFWRITSMPESRGIPIAAFRCSGCGFVEFYSHNHFGAV